jgi:hypothetical protein
MMAHFLSRTESTQQTSRELLDEVALCARFSLWETAPLGCREGRHSTAETFSVPNLAKCHPAWDG